jgi:hypothetical protein
MGTMMSLFVSTTMIPAVRPIADEYGMGTTTMVNLCCFMSYVFAVPAIACHMSLLQNYSPGLIIRVAITIQFLGSLFRMYTFVNGEFWPILVGHAINALPGPVYMCVNNIIINAWFSDKERATASGLLLVAVPIGQAMSFALQAFFLNQNDTDMNIFLWKMMLAQNAVFLFAYLFMVIGFRDKPKVPPSPVAEAKVETLDFFQTFKVIKEDSKFGLLIFAFALKQGAMQGYGILVSDVYTPFGFTARLMANYGVMLFFAGIVGTIFWGVFIDFSGKIKTSLITCCVGTALSLVFI